MKKNERVLVSKEAAAGYVSTEMCHIKNGSKDTNGSKGSMKI